MTLRTHENLGQEFTDHDNGNTEMLDIVQNWAPDAEIEGVHDSAYNEHLGDLLAERVKRANLEGKGETPIFRWLLDRPAILIALMTVGGAAAIGLQHLLSQPHV